MAISVTDPLDLAIKKTRAILFEPFNASKWFGLGFCAFLAQFVSGGSMGFNPSGAFNMGGNSGVGPGPSNPGVPNFNGNNPFDTAANWLQTNLVVILGVGVLSLILIIALVLLLQWLGSRGEFMFIDGVIKNDGAVKRPWREFEPEGNSLFKFKVVYTLICVTFMILLLGICLLIAWSDISSRNFGTLSMVAIAVFSLPALVLFLARVVIDFLLSNFVVPTMYKRRIGVMDAWQVVRDTFMDHKGTLGLYFLFLIALGIGLGIVAMIGTLCLCCIPAIPYLGTVILLPIFVFSKSYSLYFLEQFGPAWQFFTPVSSSEFMPPHDPTIPWQDAPM